PGSPTTFGRSAPPVRELSVPTDTVEYVPVDIVRIVDSCQWPAIRWAHAFVNRGVRTTDVRLKMCRWSARQLAYSPWRLKGSCPAPAPFKATSLSVRQCDQV